MNVNCNIFFLHPISNIKIIVIKLNQYNSYISYKYVFIGQTNMFIKPVADPKVYVNS